MPWGQLLLVYLVPLLSMAAMLNFAPLLPMVRDDFALSNTWAGMLASSTILSHTMLQLPGGQIAHRLGLKRAIGLGLVLIGIAVVGCGLAPSFAVLLVWRCLLGVGTATVFIAGLALTNLLVPVSQRLVAQGAYGAAANLGVLLVQLFAERIARQVGWRGSFVAEGLLILAVAALFAGLLPSRTKYPQPIPAPWSDTLRHGALYLLGLAHVLTYGVFMACATWAATFLWEAHGVGLEWAGPLAALLAASAIVARLVGAFTSRGRERAIILGSCFGTSVLVALVPLLPGVVGALLALMALGGVAAVSFAANFSYVALIPGRGDSARGLSLMNFVANVGALLFPLVIGYVLDQTGSFAVGFGVVAGVGVVGSVALSLWLPRPVKRLF